MTPTLQPFPLLAIPIDAVALNTICSHAQNCAPQECCGLLFGTSDPTAPRIHHVQACANVADGDRDSAYTIDPAAVLTALASPHEEGELLGFYHSHPNGSRWPSNRDYQNAWPGYLYLIAWKNGHGGWQVDARLAPNNRHCRPTKACYVLCGV